MKTLITLFGLCMFISCGSNKVDSLIQKEDSDYEFLQKAIKVLDSEMAKNSNTYMVISTTDHLKLKAKIEYDLDHLPIAELVCSDNKFTVSFANCISEHVKEGMCLTVQVCELENGDTFCARECEPNN